jgi:bifunctional DNA-binding transcriptional regulator/antitoxin component of YhaV-PrlF toxin-antitoxin module
LTDELPLGITTLSAGGTTTVPRRVREVLKLDTTLHKKGKLLWTQQGNEIAVERGTPQSSYRKTMLRRGGRAAVPKHIMEALKLKPTLDKEERMVWIQKGDQIIVRKGEPQSSPTE